MNFPPSLISRRTVQMLWESLVSNVFKDEAAQSLTGVCLIYCIIGKKLKVYSHIVPDKEQNQMKSTKSLFRLMNF